MAESRSVGEINAIPVVSVVVAVRGNPEALIGLLGVLARQQGIRAGGLDVVVVDNHDHPHAAVRAAVRAGRVAGLSVAVVHEPQPGLSRARNRGIRLARGRFVLITDPDARPTLTWAARLVEALEVSGAYWDAAKIRAEAASSGSCSEFLLLRWGVGSGGEGCGRSRTQGGRTNLNSGNPIEDR